MDTQVLFQSALESHQKGQLQQAAEYYRQVLAQEPNQVEALHLLGVLSHQQGEKQAAIAFIEQAIALKPDYAEAFYNLGLVLQEQGQLEAAIERYQHALTLKPDYPDAHNNLGNIFKTQGNIEAAITHYRQAVNLKPDNPKAYKNLGLLFLDQGKVAEAAACFHQALQHQPDYPDARHQLQSLLQHHSWETLLLEERPEGYYLLGTMLQEQGLEEEAIVCLERAIQLKPDYAQAYKALAVPYVNQGELAQAIAYYRQAIQHHPEFAEAHTDLGWTLLMDGQMAEGWHQYEWRLQTKNFEPPPFAVPQWDGSPLAGATILLHAEQGLGDTIQFVRYAPRVAALGGRVWLACQPALVSLMRSVPGIDQVFGRLRDLPPFQVHCPLMSLPHALHTTLDTIPAQVPYLFPSRQGVTLPRSPDTRMKIGIVWASGYFNRPGAYEGYLLKSCTLDHFVRLLHLPGIDLYSLQVGRDADAIQRYAHQPRLHNLTPQLTDFARTAAAIAHLDLIISVDTAVAHLAGALGKPTWTLLPQSPDWRWMLQRQDSPWYPTMRLFRQSQAKDWDTVFAEVKAALAALLQGAVAI